MTSTILDQGSLLRQAELVETIAKASPETRGLASKYSAEDKLLVVQTYFLTQSLRKTNALTGVAEDTIARWRMQEWWEPVYKEVIAAKNKELDGKLTAIIDKATVKVEERLDQGDPYVDNKGKVKFKPVSAKDAATTLGILFDKRDLIRGNTQGQGSPESTEKLLQKLHESFSALAKIVKPELKAVEGTFEIVKDDTAK